ncbi:mannose-1-phosphate guanylyltransferase/mannose-6-phosphate isomerase [Photobacterium sp. 1_MG-2023]|uniref:mannose-1-phosphate guanylyltransferase/mannose-6-phosphate isomerase n=1 Tax=Photobacterium sp. 1_MG-2023 TaxID=3062646 RepID=UPI0026E46100|nr:mannose-1-phosphate guanylyltransferase/mannose-6-phosphate isomerase [Photobacterium sp. 1_MG-2023]MDO6707159.1 mannose-1-phosphate guanylyltransferase/mannose-6-phosphate isomerase [Photobacterium sp. 1_MG-2023]
MQILPVILAGGTGSRLWPLSREQYPKQFLRLLPAHASKPPTASNASLSMLQQTIQRLSDLDHRAPLVVCQEAHRFLAAEQLRTCHQGDCRILLEPHGRNTAPAVALSALLAQSDAGVIAHESDDPLLLVLAADHHIVDDTAFVQAIEQAIPLAASGQLVTFGITPQSPETGYGYIKRGAPSGSGYAVDQFVEKPDLPTAREYLVSGDYFWNSGMFLFRASVYLQALSLFRPDILAACQASITSPKLDHQFIRIDEQAFAQCPSESIDYAVMEKTTSAVMVPMDAGWCDLGAWSALWAQSDKDVSGNVTIGDVLTAETQNCYLRSDGRLVATVGLRDVVVIETKDAVLVAAKEHVQDVKDIVTRLREAQRPEFDLHREVYRPWGKYDQVDAGLRHQVKHITVNPGEKLSLQMHHHRAEHWVVVCGTAQVTVGDKTWLLSENESTYIPIGVVHALENPGKIPLEIIEVQSGSYLGEDDIVRFEDRYGRQ